MTLSKYQKGFAGLQGFIFALPVLSKLFDAHSGVTFPPLGDDVAIFRFFALLIVGVCAIVPYALPARRFRTGIVLGLLFVGVASAALYLHWEKNYVVPISFPASDKHPDGGKTFVIRGSERQPSLAEPYRSMADDELIENTGHSDVRLEKVYTKASLQANRSELFWPYVFSLSSFELLLGVVARGTTR